MCRSVLVRRRMSAQKSPCASPVLVCTNHARRQTWKNQYRQRPQHLLIFPRMKCNGGSECAIHSPPLDWRLVYRPVCWRSWGQRDDPHLRLASRYFVLRSALPKRIASLSLFCIWQTHDNCEHLALMFLLVSTHKTHITHCSLSQDISIFIRWHEFIDNDVKLTGKPSRKM